MTSQPLGLSPRSTDLPAPRSIRDGMRFPSLPDHPANGVPVRHRSATCGKHLILNQLTRCSRCFFFWEMRAKRSFGFGASCKNSVIDELMASCRSPFAGGEAGTTRALNPLLRRRLTGNAQISSTVSRKHCLLREARLSAETLPQSFLLICGLVGRRKTKGVPRMPRAAQTRKACRMPAASAMTPTRTTATARATKFSAM